LFILLQYILYIQAAPDYTVCSCTHQYNPYCYETEVR